MTQPEEKRIQISVLVPVAGPADNLVEIHREAVAQIEKLGVAYEFVYMVSTASKEGLERALTLRQKDPDRVRVFSFAGPVGDARMLAAGFESARGEIVFTLPPHFDSDPKGLQDLYEAIANGADLAFASRSAGREGEPSRLQSRMFNRLVSWATGTRFIDIASGTRAMRREVLEEVTLYGDSHRFLPVLAERLGFALREVWVGAHPRARTPLVHSPRVYLWRSLDILSIFFLSRFTRRPLRLFGGVGSLFGAVGAGILVVVAIQWFLGTPLADRPILVLGTLLLGLGVQAFTIGLLGELILFFHARNIRDYRIAAVYGASEPPLPEETPGPMAAGPT